MSSSGEAIEADVPSCLRNKKLYLSTFGNTGLLGIRIEPMMTDGAEETGKPCILGGWDLRKDHGIPVGMGILVKDSKVYMIGGEHPGCNGCLWSQPGVCAGKSSLSSSVYECAIPDGGPPTLSPCDSIPQLPTAMASPIIVKHLGEIYLLYGGESSNICWGLSDSDSESPTSSDSFDKCFLVLSKDGKQWKPLTPPPFYHKATPAVMKYVSRQMCYLGAVGTKLCLGLMDDMYCYDINKDEWERKGRHNWIGQQGSITLSSLSSLSVGQSSYVVISTDFDSQHHKIYAALVDEEGNVLRRQLIDEEKRSEDKIISFIKLIELESKKEKDDNSTFALVFNLGRTLIRLTVFRVSLLSFSKEVEHVAKKTRLLDESKFLKAKVLVNRRYDMENQCGFNACVIDDAFFY
ncbi:hypothetical protein LINGRAHAP2_LOCUS8414 [Linum grandiflorum]